MLSVLRTVIFKLDKAGAVEKEAILAAIDDTAKAHRETGDPNQLADAIQAVGHHLRDFIASQVSTRNQ